MAHTLVIISNDETAIGLIESVNIEYKFHFNVKVYDAAGDWVNRLRQNPCPVLLLDMDQLDRSILGRKLADYTIVLKSEFTIQEQRIFFKKGAFDCLTKSTDKTSLYYLLHEVKAAMAKEDNSDRKARLAKECLISLKSHLAYDLIFGNVKNSKEIWDRSKWAGLSVVPNTAMILHIDEFFRLTKNKSKLWEQTIRNEIIAAIQTFRDLEIRDILPVITAADKITVLLSIPLRSSQEEYKQLAVSYAERMKQHLNEKTGYTVTIGIGSYYEDARNLHVSYQEALQAQTYKFFSGTNAILHIADIQPFENETALLPNSEIETVASKLTVGDFTGVKESLEKVWNTVFTQQNVDPEVLKLQILDLLTTLARSAINGGAKPQDIISIHLEYARDLLMVENTSQMKKWFQEAIKQLLERAFLDYNEETLKSVQKAIAFIEHHYIENISLEQVASHVHLSPNYFSNLFKKTTGSSFIEYITNLRVDKAKSMLMDLDLTIYQIASAVGYQDARYFSRVFKAISGKTPSKYRNSLLGSQG
ncbi:helix-turn-helix domain-containing protein [Neobacillus mesonae]|uniref:AraC family transcriptional regulator n=1 Tax=Neobacillus mesonae TaxID=1193713 RepID=A0A3T0I4Q5_9BACI|nr:helix-turn-helix domain-containing protein [Neobacillus mesonae]AZU64348.1 AraC family transcriptional regulator [Neobacillus mesonae]MED4203566.1 AraC family transcriptional regulator [Neobacillus mesonae]